MKTNRSKIFSFFAKMFGKKNKPLLDSKISLPIDCIPNEFVSFLRLISEDPQMQILKVIRISSVNFPDQYEIRVIGAGMYVDSYTFRIPKTKIAIDRHSFKVFVKREGIDYTHDYTSISKENLTKLQK